MVNRYLVIFSGTSGLLKTVSSMPKSERRSQHVNLNATAIPEHLMNTEFEGPGTFSWLESFPAHSHWLSVLRVVVCMFPCFSQGAQTGAPRQPGGVGWEGEGGSGGRGHMYACG